MLIGDIVYYAVGGKLLAGNERDMPFRVNKDSDVAVWSCRNGANQTRYSRGGRELTEAEAWALLGWGKP